MNIFKYIYIFIFNVTLYGPDQGWIKDFFSLRGFLFIQCKRRIKHWNGDPLEKKWICYCKIGLHGMHIFFIVVNNQWVQYVFYSLLFVQELRYMWSVPKKFYRAGTPSDFEITGSATEIKTYCDKSMGFPLWIHLRGRLNGNYFKSLCDSTRHNAILTEGGFCSINQHFKIKA